MADQLPTDFEQILANQRALGKGFLWLLIVPFVLTAIMTAMFFFITTRLTDVEVVTKRMNIDRYLELEGNYLWAVRGYEGIAKTHPSASVLARLGVLYFQADPKNEKIAIETLDQARNMDPNNWEVYRSLTCLYTATNRPKDAIGAGQKALALNDLDSGTYNNLAWSFATAGDENLRNLQLAESYALKAIDLTHDKHAEYFDTLAQVYVAKGERDHAIQAFRRAIALASRKDIQTYQKHLKQYFPDESL
jgi:tetratricopeptide (TPR) repeat protein